jgi:hypothetical protein
VAIQIFKEPFTTSELPRHCVARKDKPHLWIASATSLHRKDKTLDCRATAWLAKTNHWIASATPLHRKDKTLDCFSPWLAKTNH